MQKNKYSKSTRFKQKLTRILLTSVLIFPSVTSPISVLAGDDHVLGNGNDIINEDYEAGISLAPVAPSFRSETLMNWTPEEDPDSELNRSSIPLNTNRFQGQQINKLANPKAKITGAAIVNPNQDTTISVGGSDYDIYAFDNWQYIDSLIHWQSTEEGVFAFPSPDIVDAAHKNGVPVYAAMHFPWGSGHYKSLEELNNIIEKDENGTFPVADKMIEAAAYFGFDGYFFNQESAGAGQEVALQLNEFLRYFRRESRNQGTPLNISWYDAMDNSGNLSHQDAVNENNDLYMKPVNDEDDYGVDEFFMNYNWNRGDKINKTYDHMEKNGRNPYDAYAGFELQQNSYNTSISREVLLDEEGKIRSSIALYAPDSTMGLAKNPADFHKQENILYTGLQGDPTLVDDSDHWSGMSRFVTDKSVISGTEFATNFNTGHGKQWYENGKVVRNGTWNNRSVQSINPTWRFWVKDLVGDRANIEYDFDEVYNGGTSIGINGELSKGSINNVMLYSTQLDVMDSSQVELTYKSNDLAKLSLGVSFKEDYRNEEQTFFELPNTKNEWETVSVDLSEFSGQMIHALSIKLEAQETANISANLGSLKVKAQDQSKLPGPENINVNEVLYHSTRSAEFRANWDPVEGAEYYEVYQVNNDGVRNLIGVTTNTHFYAEEITRDDENAYEDNTTTIEVKTVNSQLESGESSQTNFQWETNIDFSEEDATEQPENVALNAKITDVSFENSAEPAAAAVDGSSKSKWAATNKRSGYMDIELSEPKTVKRWRVEHAEYGGEAKDMNTVDFELQYKNKDGDWIVAEHIKNNDKAVTDVLLKEPVTAQEWKLKINNAGTSPWQAIRIYEWQMFESDVFPRPTNINTNQVEATRNGDKIDLKFKKVPENAEIHLYNSINAEEPITTVKAGEMDEKDTLKRGVDVKTQVNLQDFINERGSMGHVFYSLQPEFNIESSRNSVSVKIDAPEQSTYIHVKSVSGEGLNTTYNLVHEDGTVIETGGTSDSGNTLDLPVGKYSLRLTSVPKGYNYKRAYSFEVVAQEESVEVLIELEPTPGYSELGKLIYETGKINLDNYTEKTAIEVQKALELAQTIHKTEQSTSEDYLNAIANLERALQELVELEIVDVRDLEDLLVLAKNKDENLYTEETMAKLTESIKDAEAVLADEEALTQELVNQAKKSLQEAYDGLILKEGKLDKTQLEATLLEAKSIELDDYTLESYEYLQEIIRYVEETLTLDDLTQEQLNTLNDDLLEAIENLEVVKLDTSELKAKLEEAKSFESTDYTKDSYDALLEEIAKAEELLNSVENQEKMNYVKQSITQEDIDDTVKKLDQAIQNLELLDKEDTVDTLEIEELIKLAQSIDGNLYTEESYEALSDAIIAAKEVLAEESILSQERVDDAQKNLQTALDNLELVSGKPGDSGEPNKPEKPGDSGESNKPGKPGDSGEPNKPGKPGDSGEPNKPGKPGDSGEPNKPGKPGDSTKPNKPGKPGDSTKPSKDGALPKTGMGSSKTFIISGLVIVCLGIAMLLFKKENKIN